jgi:hypothetical protein
VLDTIDHIASIATAIVAVWVWIAIIWRRAARVRALERLLRQEKESDRRILLKGTGLRSITRLSADLRMTEEEILAAAFSSKRIEVKVAVDKENGRASALMFRYRNP